jgi:hypothetical protein
MKKILAFLVAWAITQCALAGEVGGYPNANALGGTERMLSDQSGVTVDVTPTQVLSYTNATNHFTSIADSTGNLSYCFGLNACANAVFSNALKGYVTAFGDSTCGGAGSGLSVSGGNVEDTCIGWRAGSNLGAGSQYVTITGVGTLRYAPLATNVTCMGVDDITTATLTTASTLNDVICAGVGNMRNPQSIQQVTSIGDGGTLQGQASAVLNLLDVIGYATFPSTSMGSLTQGGAYGDGIGVNVTSGQNFLLLGYHAGNSICTSLTDVMILSTGASATDCATGAQTHYLNVMNIITTTGTGTPSTSTTKVAGALAAAGGTVVTDLAARADVQVFSASGTWTVSTKGSPTAMKIICIGAGGGGGGGITTTSGTASSGGGGGGGGAYWEATVSPAVAASPQTITVGAAGAAGTAGNPGGIGGTSSFGALIQCPGGGGGGPGQSAAASGGGGGAGTRTAGQSGSGSTGGTGGSSNGTNGGSGASGNNNSTPGGAGSGAGTASGAAGSTGGLASGLFIGGNGGGAGAGVSTTPGTFAGGDALQANSSAHITGGAAGSSSNGGTGTSGTTGIALGWAPGAGGAGGGSAILTFSGGAGGSGGLGSGGGGGGSANSTGAAGAGGAGGAGLVVVITYF